MAPGNQFELIKLLEAKDAAQAVFSAASRAAREGASAKVPMSERLALDIAVREALTASCAADRAYDAAIEIHIANQNVAA